MFTISTFEKNKRGSMSPLSHLLFDISCMPREIVMVLLEASLSKTSIIFTRLAIGVSRRK